MTQQTQPTHEHDQQSPQAQQIQGPCSPEGTSPPHDQGPLGPWHCHSRHKRRAVRGCAYGALLGVLLLSMCSFFAYRSIAYNNRHDPRSGRHMPRATPEPAQAVTVTSMQAGTATPEATTTAAPTAQPSPATPVAAAGIWIPPLETSWQWQLTTPVDQSFDVTLYDIDGFDNSASVVASLHAKGRKVFCYIDAGTFENWRPDASQFPASVKGNAVDGWPGEQWLDIRQLQVLAPVMHARLRMCQAKGFDGVEFDNVDGYTNKTGFPLSANDQLAYNTWLAHQAHLSGMSAGLKNDLDQVQQLLPSFDWALDEQCFQYQECDLLTPFIQAGKAVFEVEYAQAPSQFCQKANALDFNSLRKKLALDAPMTACR